MTRSASRALLIVALVVLVLAAVVLRIATRVPDSPFDVEGGAPAAAASAELISRGAYLNRLADCVACHSTATGKPFAGGLEMATPMGAIFATNITPDPETGIGGYSLADFDRALRHGVAKDGHRLYPAMPYPSYAKLSDEDVRALFAFFTREVQPVQQANHASEIPWPLNMRWPLAVWNVVFADDKPYQPVATQDAVWNRGAYIVQGAGHCGSCHTPRGVAMNELALDDGHAAYLSGALLDGWYAPSLRGDMNTGLGRWSAHEVVQFLKQGRNRHAVVFGSMAEAFNNSTQFMNDDDLRAIAVYLKSLPGDPARDGAPWVYDDGTNGLLSSVDKRLQVPGAQTFVARCSSCHGMNGQGQTPWVPPLAGTASMLSTAVDSSVNVTLNGSARVVAGGLPDAYRMPAFRNQLTDAEIAEVLSFVRTSWGHRSSAVTVDEVRHLRARTDPASPTPIILQMR